MNWYVKNADGKVFGPVDDAKLLAWVKDGRVEPFAGLSNDLQKWRLASLEPSLEMDWIVENEPGRFYGPTHRAVIDDLIRNKALSATCRIYRDDHGGAAEKAMAELKAEAERTIAAKDEEIASLKESTEAFRVRAESGEARVAELETKIARLTETKQREWQSEVVEPEIVSDEPPPAVREIFKPGRAQTLADLERQAQAELARMGPAKAKRFFGLKR